MELQQKVGIEPGRTGGSGATPDLSSGQDYAKWRDGGEVEYPVDMDPFSFTRSMDRATSDLLTHCIERKPFDRATIIKRKAAGGAAAGEIFLRIDFTKVLLINVAWSHDEPIKETYQFVSRAVTIRYAPQLPNGQLGDPLPPAFWSMSKSYHPLRALTHVPFASAHGPFSSCLFHSAWTGSALAMSRHHGR